MTIKSRNRGVVYIEEAFLCHALDLPKSQRVIGVHADPLRFGFAVHLEGDDLPEVPPNAEPPNLNATRYVENTRWMYRGADLSRMVRALAERWEADGDNALGSAAGCLRRVLDEGWDPR